MQSVRGWLGAVVATVQLSLTCASLPTHVWQARNNNHTFASSDELLSQLIYNYKSVGTTDYQAYFFEPTSDAAAA